MADVSAGNGVVDSVADITGDVAPRLWRRYLPMLLDGLRPGAKLPVPPIDEDELREAMTSHKQRLLRVGQHRPE